MADANKGRKVEFFEEIYNNLIKIYGFVLSDSRIAIALGKKVKIFDSTTISLFKDILECVGREAINGKSKGGIKSHSVINADEKVPNLVWFSPATTHDHLFLKKLKWDEHTVYIFNKGYNDYTAFEHFTEQNIGFVTRIKDNAKYEVIQKNLIPENIHGGVLSDEIIEVEINKGITRTKLKLRKIKYYDREHKRSFEFISNLFEFRAYTIAALYKLRWQIELLFVKFHNIVDGIFSSSGFSFSATPLKKIPKEKDKKVDYFCFTTNKNNYATSLSLQRQYEFKHSYYITK